MKLLLIIANEEFVDEITSSLVHNGFTATEIASTGEFTKYGDTVMLLGIEDSAVSEVLQVLRTTNRHVKNADFPFFGKVSVFVIGLDGYAKIIGKAIQIDDINL